MQQRVFLVLDEFLLISARRSVCPVVPVSLKSYEPAMKTLVVSRWRLIWRKFKSKCRVNWRNFKAFRKVLKVTKHDRWQIDIFHILSVKTWVSIGPFLYRSRVLNSWKISDTLKSYCIKMKRVMVILLSDRVQTWQFATKTAVTNHRWRKQ